MNQNKNSQALRLTTGAMFLAIFAILLLVNRQTGGFFEEFFIYLLPIPMVAYASIYNWKSALTVFAGMCAFSFFFGTFTSAFYAITAALVGLVLGTCLYYKVDLSVTMFVVMAMSAVFNVLSTVTLASLFGYDIDMELAEMQNMMNSVFEKAGNQQASQNAARLLTPQFLRRGQTRQQFHPDLLRSRLIDPCGNISGGAAERHLRHSAAGRRGPQHEQDPYQSESALHPFSLLCPGAP
jgi:hypothetical protein